MNRRLLWVLLLGAWSPLVGQLAHAEEKPPCDPWAAKIAAVQGKVEAKRTSDETWHAATRNTIYCPGDQIRVGKDARASIILINDTLIRLDQYSVITLNQIKTDEPSLLELIKGIAHFISRVPRSLKVNTPFVNAAIEGTEFVVAVGEADTTVTVFEGIVLTQNENGQVRLIQNESSIAKQGKAPEKILLARPRDTVQWALYFPPIIKGEAEDNPLQQASSLLYKGRVEEASKLLTDIDNNGEAKALQAIIAIVNNDKETAFKLASDAVQLAPDSTAPHIAMSYAWQAKLDLNAALTSAKQAISKDPKNAIAWARLAELQLSVGRLNDALDSAKKATELDSSIARTQTILGYAYLTQIKINKARTTFDNAIELDQSDPLPHLGLGLAMIRKNELAEGRREIEIAASLDPNNAIIRSYLGKAYYEEKRAPLDAEQFAMAKELDPNDPTPYYYDATRKQTENDPVGALEDLNKSIELNDNRAVYRSSLQLDQDEAARSASLARIYTDIDANQLGISEASNSLLNDPTNHSAHRLLGELYKSKPRHEIATASESLQSKLFQPANLIPLKPQGDRPSIFIQDAISNSILTDTNHAPLVTRGGTDFFLSTTGGTNNTKSDNIIAAGLYDTFSYSIGQYYFSTDGFRTNNYLKQLNYNIFLQNQFTSNLNIQFEYLREERKNGDLRYLFDLTNFSADRDEIIDEDIYRLGMNYKTSTSSNLILSVINSELDYHFNQFTTLSPGITLTETSEQPAKSNSAELGFIKHYSKYYRLVSGLGYNESDVDLTDNEVLDVFGTPIPDTEISTIDTQHSNAYLYSYYDVSESLNLTLGLSYDNLYWQRLAAVIDKEEYNPKFGMIWRPTGGTTLRLAAFEALKRSLINNATIEPTNIAGFNQFYDNATGSVAKNYAIAIDHKLTTKLFSGIEFVRRDIEAPLISNVNTGLVLDENIDTETANIYLTWLPAKNYSLTANINVDDFDRNSTIANANRPLKLKTVSTPVNLKYFSDTGIVFRLTPTYVKQKIQTAPTATDENSYWLADISVGYKFENRLGSIALDILNATDRDIKYHNLAIGNDRTPFQPYLPERTVLFKINLDL